MLLSQLPGYFKARREALMKGHPSAAFIFSAHPEYLRNPDVHHPYRQESNFFYLSGFDEPESFLVIAPLASKPGSHRTVLFVRKRDAEREMWEGERYGTDGAIGVFGADEAYPVEEFDRKLPELLGPAEEVYYRLGYDEHTDRRVLGAMEAYRRSLGRTGRALPAIGDPNGIVGELRLFKSQAEIEIHRKACQISAEAHIEAMNATRPGVNEGQIAALIDYQFLRGGCQRLGYGSIVAGGKNATCLHYRSNNEALRDGDLLLIDAGGEYDYYTADITRTFPVGRKFTSAQAKAYDLVLKSQLAAIEMTRPGQTLQAIHQRVCEILVDGFLSLGLMKGKVEEIITSDGYRRFYPHKTSHWLGMDVHDVGMYFQDGEPRRFEPGMVFTIEPGFYVQPGDLDAPSEFRNIGIRIEDDILVTKNGCENLTAGAPKGREELEEIKSRALAG